MSGNATGRVERERSESQVYCVVPARLARIRPRLWEHFANENVEVILDNRIGERRQRGDDASALDELAGRLTPGMERRTIDGRRAAVRIERPVELPPELERYERELTFLASPGWGSQDEAGSPDFWRRRAESAEQQAVALAGALIAAADALRVHRGMSPRRFREVVRIDAALDRYYNWRVRSGSAPR